MRAGMVHKGACSCVWRRALCDVGRHGAHTHWLAGCC